MSFLDNDFNVILTALAAVGAIIAIAFELIPWMLA
jgi:hypothetical protein